MTVTVALRGAECPGCDQLLQAGAAVAAMASAEERGVDFENHT